MLVRIVLVTVVVAAGLATLAQGSLLARVGLAGKCETVAAPAGHSDDEAEWKACRAGRLEGRPDLRLQSCKPLGIVGDLEYWQCQARVASGRGIKP